VKQILQLADGALKDIVKYYSEKKNHGQGVNMAKLSSLKFKIGHVLPPLPLYRRPSQPEALIVDR